MKRLLCLAVVLFIFGQVTIVLAQNEYVVGSYAKTDLDINHPFWEDENINFLPILDLDHFFEDEKSRFYMSNTQLVSFFMEALEDVMDNPPSMTNLAIGNNAGVTIELYIGHSKAVNASLYRPAVQNMMKDLKKSNTDAFTIAGLNKRDGTTVIQIFMFFDLIQAKAFKALKSYETDLRVQAISKLYQYFTVTLAHELWGNGLSMANKSLEEFIEEAQGGDEGDLRRKREINAYLTGIDFLRDIHNSDIRVENIIQTVNRIVGPQEAGKSQVTQEDVCRINSALKDFEDKALKSWE